MDCSPPDSSVHGILQARILEWVCHSSLQGIFPTQGLNLGILYWQVDSFPSKPPGKPEKVGYKVGQGWASSTQLWTIFKTRHGHFLFFRLICELDGHEEDKQEKINQKFDNMFTWERPRKTE